MQSPLDQLTELTERQGALFNLTYLDCDKCDTIHSRVEIALPDGFSWSSDIAGEFSAIGVTSECDQTWSDLYARMHSVIDHPVIRD
jgi:hypothetical protein